MTHLFLGSLLNEERGAPWRFTSRAVTGLPERQVLRRTASERRPIRVLLAGDHIDHAGALHGAGRQLIELVKAFDPHRVQATACVLRPSSGLGDQLRDEGMPLHFWGHRSWNPVHLWHFVRCILERGIDVLHLTDFGASTYGRIAGQLTRTPAVVHIRSHHSEYQPRGFPIHVEWAYRALAPFTTRAIAVSDSVGDFAVQRMDFRPEQITILNDPLAEFSFSEPAEGQVTALRRQYGFDRSTPVIGTVTRFHPAKGIMFLLDAFPRVLDAVPEARLVLVGEGPEEPALREQVAVLGIADRVIFAGFQRDVQPYFRMFSLSVVPSLEEGFGNVAVESTALGVPVVASRSGGLPEIIVDGENGLLVEPGDSRGIADAILTLLQDPGRRASMSDNARITSQRFLMSSYLERLEAVYREAANLPPQAAS